MKKISHIWSIICTNSVTDQDTNNISLFNLVEKYTVKISRIETEKIKDKEKMIIPFEQEIISRFIKKRKNENAIFDMRIDIMSPTKKVFKGNEEKTINFDKKFENIRVRNKITNILVEKSGLYNFIIKIKEIGETKFTGVVSIPVEINIEFEK